MAHVKHLMCYRYHIPIKNNSKYICTNLRISALTLGCKNATQINKIETIKRLFIFSFKHNDGSL